MSSCRKKRTTFERTLEAIDSTQLKASPCKNHGLTATERRHDSKIDGGQELDIEVRSGSCSRSWAGI